MRFHHVDECERCDGQVVERFGVDVNVEGHGWGEAHFHQIDVETDELRFLGHGDLSVVFVEHVAQHLAEFVDGALSFGGVYVDEGVDGVESVEEKVGLQLGFELAQFCFACLGHEVASVLFDAMDFVDKFD